MLIKKTCSQSSMQLFSIKELIVESKLSMKINQMINKIKREKDIKKQDWFWSIYFEVKNKKSYF